MDSLTLGNPQDTQDKLSSVHDSDTFRFFDPSHSSNRARTASHPSLASIHEVNEENESAASRNAQPMGPPPSPADDNFGSEYRPGDFLGPSQQDEQLAQTLHRPTKRSEPALEVGEAYEYGTDPKRYKLGLREVSDLFSIRFLWRHPSRTSIRPSTAVDQPQGTTLSPLSSTTPMDRRRLSEILSPSRRCTNFWDKTSTSV